MSDVFYSCVKHLLNQPFRLTRQATVLGQENINDTGRCLMACNHMSPYDVAILISHCKRRIDFVSIVEICNKPIVGTFYKHMNAMPLDRSKVDTSTVRTLLRRLEQERIVCMFPEGRLRLGTDSMLINGKIRPGLGRIAILSQAPVIPVVVVGSTQYNRPLAYAPLRHIKYGVIFGKPMLPPQANNTGDAQTLAKDFEDAYVAQMKSLHQQLLTTMD